MVVCHVTMIFSTKRPTLLNHIVTAIPFSLTPDSYVAPLLVKTMLLCITCSLNALISRGVFLAFLIELLPGSSGVYHHIRLKHVPDWHHLLEVQ